MSIQQFDSDVNEFLDNLRRARVTPARAATAAQAGQYQPPSVTDERGRQDNFLRETGRGIFEDRPGLQRMAPDIYQRLQEEPGEGDPSLLRDLYEDPFGTMGEMASTAGGVFARRSLPMIIGSIEGGIGRLQASDIPLSPADFVDKSLRRKFIDQWSQQYGITTEDPALRAQEVFARIAVDPNVGAGMKSVAEMWNIQHHLNQQLIAHGDQVMNDAYISFDPDEGRWITISDRTYRREVLNDPFGRDPGKEAGMFIGNSLASVLPAAIAVVQPELSVPVLMAYFSMGFSGAANEYEQYQKERGLPVDPNVSVLHGIGGGALELAIERFSIGKTRQILGASKLAANRRMGQAIAKAAETGERSGIRRAAEAIAGVFPNSVKAGGKVIFVNAAEEYATQIGNNLRQVLTYDQDYDGSVLGQIARLHRGAPAAALGGAIGGGPFAISAGVSGREGGRQQRMEARRAAAQLRKTTPDTMPAVEGDRTGTPPEAIDAAKRQQAEAEQRRVRDAGGISAPPVASDTLGAVFAAEGSSNFSAAVDNARATGEAPARADLATTEQQLLSQQYADDLVENNPEFALALVETTKGKGLSRRLLGLVYRGRGSLNAEKRALFVRNVKDAIARSKGTRSIREQSEQALRNEMKDIAGRVKDGTATEQDQKRSKSIQTELTRRANARDAETKVAAEGLEVDNEIEAEQAEIDAEVDAAAPPRATPAAPAAPAAPRATPPTKPPAKGDDVGVREEDAEPTVVGFRKQEAEADADIKRLQAKQKKLVKDGKVIEGKEREYQDLGQGIAKAVERRDEARDDARMLEIDNRLEELNEELALYDRDDPGSVKAIERIEKEIVELQEEYDEIYDKYEWEAGDAVDDLIEEPAEPAKPAEAAKPDPAAKPKESVAKPEDREPLPANEVGPFQKILGRLGIIGQDTKGRSLESLSDKELLALAKRERVIPATKSMSKNQLIEAILDLRMYRLGLTTNVVLRADKEAFDKAFGARRAGESGKTLAKVIEMRRSSKEVGENPAAVEEQLTGKRPKAKSKLKQDIEVERQALEQRAANIVKDAADAIAEETGVEIVDPNTRQKVGQSSQRQVVVEQVETYSDGWLNQIEDADAREYAKGVMENAIARAKDVLALRREYKPSKAKKPTAKQVEEAEAVNESKRQEAKRRVALQEANNAVNPGGLGVVRPKKKTKAQKAKEAQEAKAQAAAEQEANRRSNLRRVNDARKRVGLKPVKSLDVSKSMSVKAVIDELVALEGGVPSNARDRGDMIASLRDIGVKPNAPGGKAAAIEVLQRVRNGGSIVEAASGPDIGKASPITEEGRAERETRATAMRWWSIRNYGRMLAGKSRKRDKDPTRTRIDQPQNIQDALNVAIEELQAVNEANAQHEKQVRDRISKFEKGNIQSGATRGKRARFRGGSKVWGVKKEDRIVVLPEDGSDVEPTYPTLTKAILENMSPDPSRTISSVTSDILVGRTALAEIDLQFGTDFVQRIGAENADGPLGLAIVNDIAAILDDAAMFGENQLVAQSVAIQQANGTVTIRVTTGEVVGFEQGTVGDKVKQLQQIEEDLEYSEREAELQIRAEIDAQAMLDEQEASELDDDYVEWSQGDPMRVTLQVNQGGADVVKAISIYHRTINMLARIKGTLGNFNFNGFVREEIKKAKERYGGRQVSLDQAQSEIDAAVATAKAKKAGLKKGDLEAVPDEMANPAELAVVRRMRQRGRRVILYRATNENGVRFNGFVSADPNTMYIRVGSLGADVFNNIKDRKARRMIRREYERIMMQLVRHENAHLIDRSESGEAFRMMADTALDVATGHQFGDLFNDQESAAEYAHSILGMSKEAAAKLAKTKKGRAEIVNELRAEAASQIDALRKSGAEGLYSDRNIVEGVLNRVRRGLTRLGLSGESAYQTLRMVEFETKVAMAQANDNAAAATGASSNVMFSSDMTIEDAPIVDLTRAEPDFSMDYGHFSVEGLGLNDGLGFREKWQDRNIRLRKTQQELENIYGKLPDDVNPVQLLDIAPGLVARKGQVFMQETYVPVVEEMMKDGISMPEMGRYLHAMHAKEVNAHLADKNGRDSGMTDQEADAIMAEIDGRSDSAKFKAHATKFQDMTRESLEIMREAGLITEDDYNNIKDKYQYYVPLADPTHDKAIEDGGREPIDGVSQIGRQMLFRKGRSSDQNILAQDQKDQDRFFEGILLHVATQRARVMRRAIHNDGLNRMVALAMGLPAADDTFVAETGPRNKDGSVNMEKLRADPRLRHAIVVRLNRPMTVAGKAFLKGEQVVVRAKNPKVTRVLNERNLSLEEISGAFKVFTLPTRLKRALATRYNIEFTLVNPVRDLMEASATLKSIGFAKVRRRLAKEMVGALATTMKYGFSRGLNVNDPQYQEYLDSGAQQNFYRIQDSDALMAMIRKEVARSKRKTAGVSITSLPGGSIRLIGRFLDNATNALDDSVRFAAWKIAKQEGFTTEQATALSRDVTVDFSKRGATWGSWANSIYSFSNVGTQGIEKLFRKGTTSAGKKVLARAFVYGMINSLINSLAFDEDEWDDIPDYIKDSNYIIPMPFLDDNGKREYVKIPIPYGVGNISVLGMLVAESMFGDLPVGDALARSVGSLGILNPIGGDKLFATETTPTDDRFGPLRRTGALRMIAPDLLDPLVSWATNYDWKGSKIQPDKYPNQPRADAGWKSTPELYKSVAKGVAETPLLGGRVEGYDPGNLDFAPELYRYLMLESLFGPGKLIDRTIKMIESSDDPTSGDWNDIPVLRRFYGSPQVGSHNRDMYYRWKVDYDMANTLNLEMKERGISTFEELRAWNEMDHMEARRAQQIYRIGQSPEGKLARNFTRKYGKLEEEAKRNGDWDTLERIDKLRQATYDKIARQYEEVLDQ